MKVIITGTTGMIGEGVMLESLSHPSITEVLSVSRKPTGTKHPKLKEYIVPDFLALQENDEMLKGYNACFFCAGVSSLGKSEEEFTKLTYGTTIQFAKAIQPKGEMTFIYISGQGTDSTEKGCTMWARVKGKTENDLAKLTFKQTFGYRIGVVFPTKGQKHVLSMYKYLFWLNPILKLFKTLSTDMKTLTQSMISLSKNGFESKVILVKDINEVGKVK
jgi:hypothetical protein